MRFSKQSFPTQHRVGASRGAGSSARSLVLSCLAVAATPLAVATPLHGQSSASPAPIASTSYRSVPRDVTATADAMATQGSARQTPTVSAIRRASPAVVNLHGQKMVRNTAAALAGASSDVVRQVNGMGTGVVIDARGYVVTNFHVVEDVSEINVTLFDGRSTRADLIASDPRSDLALVKLRGEANFPTIPRGRSDDLMIGETVIAIGNAFGYVHTSTQGIISALHRDVPVNDTQEYRDLIQTSAGINPGNSGGPLLNIDGEMIGINVAVRVNAQQIAFAIPIDQVLETVTRMVQRDNNRRLDFGLDGQADGKGGFRIATVAQGGSAQRCGLQRGDRLVAVNSSPIDDELQFALTLLEGNGVEPWQLEFERDEQRYETFLTTAVSVDQMRDPVAAAAWQVIGITARPAGEALTREVNAKMGSNYPGGLVVTDVRPGSTADQQGISPGDLLLGIHSWQTASMNDLAGILDQPEIRRGSRAKFFIIRRDQTLYGYMQLAAQARSTTRR